MPLIYVAMRNKQYQALEKPQTLGNRSALRSLPKFPGAGFVRWNESIDQPDYAKGVKKIVPRTALGQAVLLIFAQPWRARICWLCKKLFVADKPNQRYCGWECSKSAEVNRKEMWRRNHSVKQRLHGRGRAE